MIASVTALLRFYSSNPSVALRHANRAAKIVSTGGLRSLLTIVRARMGSMDAIAEKRAAQIDLLRRLSTLADSRKRNAAALANVLLPFADELSVLDVVHGADERLRLIECHVLKKYRLLDEEFYAQSYLTEGASIRPADHYLQFGIVQGLKPNAYFDPFEYIAAYPDLAAFGMDPVIHYALFGWHEGRSAGSLFDGAYYLECNPDVAASGMSPLHHFLEIGRREHLPPRRPKFGEGGFVGMERTAGTLILVCHDAQLGGAQQIVRILAEWLLKATRYDVKLVIMGNGPFLASFAEIAPVFDVSAFPESEVPARLKAFAGQNVKAVFVNSVASGGFFRYWSEPTPAVAFIHELPKVLRLYSENLELFRERTTKIIGGSKAVCDALESEFGIDRDRLETAYSFIEALDRDRLVEEDGKAAAKSALGLDPEAFVVTGCGVLHWRKSPDKFIETAEKVIASHGDATQFVWIGGGPDQDQCERMVAERGLGGNVRFTGYEPDIMRWLNASDCFLLPSEEDPFPLVCLYAAMALNPIVCFQDAGGIPEFVANDCGVAVPFGSVDAMAAAVLRYATDEDLRRGHGRTGRDLVREHYTVAAAGPRLLHYVREAAGLRPHVSVVVPNYNYERFLGERLRSIRNQTFQDFEVILLDDASSDGSVEIMREWADARPGTQLVVNTSNTGSPFAQWMAGMELARSELMWIAEADDSCLPDFLAMLLPQFADRNVFLGYTKSVPVDVNGEPSGDYETLYLNRIANKRWSRPYVVTDHEEASLGLGIANCIPNASSVVFRRFEPEVTFAETVKGMRMCGDWLFYLRAMRGGLVAYCEKPLNLHRRHPGTITQNMEGSRRYFDEFATVRRYVGNTYRLGAEALAKIRDFTIGDLDRFGISEQSEREKIIELSTRDGKKLVPSILFVASDLAPGGGQMFVIRLANAWARRGGRAVLLNTGHFPDHPKVVVKIDPRVSIFHANEKTISFSELVTRFDIDLVHSAIWWADRYVQDAIVDNPRLPWITTMHGCHETMLDNPAIDPTFGKRFKAMLERIDRFVHTADKNLRVFEKFGEPTNALRIFNGVEVEAGAVRSRADLGLREEATVLCLATRAIAEKGWFEAVALTETLNSEGHAVDLMLIGEGPAADIIGKAKPANVKLYGQVGDLHSYIGAADIGLLPSSFAGESMPLILLEMMAMGKPVVATDVGSISAIVGTGMDAGGYVVPLAKGRVDLTGFLEAIRALLDADQRAAVGKRARERFEAQFTMTDMVDKYDALYREAIADRSTGE